MTAVITTCSDNEDDNDDDNWQRQGYDYHLHVILSILKLFVTVNKDSNFSLYICTFLVSEQSTNRDCF